VRGRVEVAREEDGDAVRGERRQSPELILDVGHAQVVLELEDLGERRAVADLVRAVGVGRQVHVGDGNDTPGGRLDEDVETIRSGRVDDRIAGDDLGPRVAVPTELLRQRARVHRPLLEADDVGAGSADRDGDLVERLGAPGGRPCRTARLEVELVAEKSREDPNEDGAGSHAPVVWHARPAMNRAMQP
jgi:hypothetical protein